MQMKMSSAGVQMLVALEGHGREDLFAGVDLSRTVGWFTALYPVRLVVTGRGEPGELLKGIKEQLRQVPDRGIGYGLLRYLNEDAAIRDSLQMEDAAVSFNYLGQFDQVLAADAALSPAPESSGAAFSPSARRAHLIDINAAIEDGQLRITWTYSENLHRRDTIDALATSYLEALRQLIAHCLSPNAGGYTSSDFRLAGLDQRELDKVLGRVGRSRERGLPRHQTTKDTTR